MAATMEDIKRWIARGRANKQSFLIVMCDTYDFDDYPVFVEGDEEDCQQEYTTRSRGGNMQTVMEVYDLRDGIDVQLKQHRAFPPWLVR